ncbi:phosphate transporter permease subunit PstC [Rugosibacter aromaticivorans]|uniref:Phosphate transport system permease protein n=1 Tax=Rugosibacter aromaticivorans TaxID=1565605 RepID=A0A0C5JCK2_9PROT|nr:phosphate ABC transporter permease PstC [Rugosibacter aromaticivorans]AJP49535.1 phosphate transporter permease subunit PstC [Rugosibacter aromaticivorans]TBR15329.1 MAG: phosphate ABC transporter permease PstC [Rugosibacter sp.]
MADNTKSKRSSSLGELIFFNVTRLFAMLTLLILIGILVSLVYGAMPSIDKFGLPFLWRSEWNPPMNEFGALVHIYGTLVTSLIALIIAVPVSFGIALFLTELSPVWLRRPLGVAIELLAGIPSIVYGMWGLLVFAPIFGNYIQPFLTNTVGHIPLIGRLFQGAPIGIGLLSAGVILSIMIIPFIASVMRDVFEVTPGILKESAYAVGATTWEVVWNIVLPYTRVGVIGGIMLGLGRALGETMAVTFVIGNSDQLDTSSLYAAGNSIASALANEFTEAVSPIHSASLIELGLILFLITFVVLVFSKLLLMRLNKQQGQRT